MKCHASSCTDPDSLSPEDAVDDGGVPAHPQCATYADDAVYARYFYQDEDGNEYGPFETMNEARTAANGRL